MKKKIVVAVIDSGLDRKDCYIKEKSIQEFKYDKSGFRVCNSSSLSPHGTEVSKVIFKEASNVEIISVQILRQNNHCFLSALIKAIEFCIQKKVDVINMSLGVCNITSDKLGQLYDVCLQATNENIVIFAAEHNGSGMKSYPANFNNVIGIKTIYGMQEYCKLSYKEKMISFSDSLVYVPNKTKSTIRNGNSFLCPLMTGLYCKFVEIGNDEQYSFLDFINDFSKGENVSKIFLNKYEESDRNYVVGKKVLFFSDNLDHNNLQIYNMYKEVCNIFLCFNDIYQKSIADIVQILKEADIFFIGALSGNFIYENEKYMRVLIALLAEHIEIITVFPILNTYERLELMKKTGNIIKSIYK